MKNNSIHSSTVHAGISTVQHSLVPTNLVPRFSTSTIFKFCRYLGQYWSNIFSVRLTDTKFDKLNREIHYQISIRSQNREMSFDEIDLVWKMFTEHFVISKNLIDKKIYKGLPCVSYEEFQFFNCRYDGSDFDLRVHLKSFKKFLHGQSENLHARQQHTNISLLADAVKNVLRFRTKKVFGLHRRRLLRGEVYWRLVVYDCWIMARALRLMHGH